MAALFFALMMLAGYDAGDKAPNEEAAGTLSKVRRIYVDILTGGDSALQIRELLMASLQRSKLFIITEDEDKADATLKGAGSDAVFTDTFQSSDSINAHTQVGGGSSGSTRNVSARSSNRYGGLSIGENQTHHSQERKHEAMATLRLVRKDGDVIWSATAENLGGKFLGAHADVADKIAQRLGTHYTASEQEAHQPRSHR